VGGRGYLLTAVLPTRLAGKLRSPAGQAVLHPYRDPAAV
jgi:hypothetical protein